jgi:hypothetical protein
LRFEATPPSHRSHAPAGFSVPARRWQWEVTRLCATGKSTYLRAGAVWRRHLGKRAVREQALMVCGDSNPSPCGLPPEVTMKFATD